RQSAWKHSVRYLSFWHPPTQLTAARLSLTAALDPTWRMLPRRRRSSAGLRGRANEDLVERHPPRARDGERNDLGDVLRADREVADEVLGGLLGLGVRDVVGQLGRHGAGLDDRHADVGLKLLAQRLRPAVDAPLGRRV